MTKVIENISLSFPLVDSANITLSVKIAVNI